MLKFCILLWEMPVVSDPHDFQWYKGAERSDIVWVDLCRSGDNINEAESGRLYDASEAQLYYYYLLT